jgi:hypothetical protein
VVKFIGSDVPPKVEGYIDWREIAKELRAHPGQWAEVVVKEGDNAVTAAWAAARYMTRGQTPHFPRGEFEATTRKNVVYGRYVGKRGG